MVRPEWSRLLRVSECTSLAIMLLAGMALGQSRPQVDFHRIDFAEVSGSRQSSSIVQDPRGFMWVVSGNGLVRYDGSRAKVFRHDPQRPTTSLAHNQVWELFLDRSGGLAGDQRHQDRATQHDRRAG